MSKTFNQPLQSPDKSIQQFGIRMKFKTLFMSDDIGCGRKKNTAIILTGHSFVTCPCPSNSWPNSAKWSVISHPDNLPVVQYAGQYWCSQIRVSINLCKVNPNAQHGMGLNIPKRIIITNVVSRFTVNIISGQINISHSPRRELIGLLT